MLNVNKMMVGSVPCFEIAPIDEPIYADLLLYHGWGSHATKQCFRGKLLAGFGYRVVVPEIALHGERGACAYESVETLVNFLEVLLESIKEAQTIISEGFSEQRPLFVIGHSLGGMITLGAAMENAARVDGFIAMNSTAQWSQYEKMMRGVFPGESLDILESVAFKKQVEALEPYDPASWQEKGMDKPVLLTNGALDQTLPATLNEAFCKAYAPANVSQVVFPEAGHVVTDGMLAEVLTFIEKHTKPRG